MKTIILFIIIVNSFFTLTAQTQISGEIKDIEGLPLVGANIYIKDSYDGATSDLDGKFNFDTSTTGTQILVVQYLGYNSVEKNIDLTKNNSNLIFTLIEDTSSLDPVVLIAGSFDASDEKKAVVFKPMDIVTTASASGDIYGALSTLPGSQTVGEEGRLFVRGGEAYETKTHIDGLQVDTPYLFRLQDIPTRGRFSPLLFSGTMFSTGGYSAEYGQALSSVLLLTTNGIPAEDKINISLYSLGLGLSQTKVFKKSAYILSLDYSNFKPYFNTVPQTSEWEKPPESFYSTFGFVTETRNDGFNKTLISYNSDKSKIFYPFYGFDQPNISIALLNNNVFIKNSHKQYLTDRTKIHAGISFNYDNTIIELDTIAINDKLISSQFKVALTTRFSNKIELSYGGDLFYKNYKETITIISDESDFIFKDFQGAYFTEAQFSLSSKLAFRLGVRGEYSNTLNSYKIMPRVSLAYKISKYSQFSSAYGIFNQNPEFQYLKFTDKLNPETASHYILNYQYKNKNRVFRVEGYYKKYDNLVTFITENVNSEDNYQNNGFGYAKGVDIFYRDSETIKNGDFWLSYSFLDTKKLYKDYIRSATPTFFSKHNLSFVYKQWISKIKSHIGMTYTFASGRPYFDPNKPDELFLSDKTKDYNNLSINYAYDMSKISKFPVTFYASVSNVLGSKNIFGFKNAFNTSSNSYDLIPVQPQADRFYLVAFFITLNK
jgi:hypothetical protein